MSSVQFDVSDGESAASDFAWSPDGTRIAVLSRLLRRVSVFDAQTGKLLGRLTDLAGGASSVGFDAAGNVVCGPLDRPGDAATIWDVDRNTMRSLPGPAGPEAGLASNMLYEFAIDQKSNRLLGVYQVPAGKGARMALALYDLSTGALLSQDGPSAMGLAMASGGSRAAFSGVTGQLDVLDTATGAIIQHIDANANSVAKVAFAPDGQIVATGSVNEGYGKDRRTGEYGELRDGDILQIWNLADGRRIAAINGPVGVIRSIDFSKDGRRIAVSDGRGIVLVADWRDTSRTPQSFVPDKPQTVVARFSPDGGRLARLLTGTATLVIENLAVTAAH